jgi:hypothetical protein
MITNGTGPWADERVDRLLAHLGVRGQREALLEQPPQHR